MRRFNLEEYLKDTSKEIITRDGRKARIICTDAKGDRPIIALVERFDGDAEDSHSYTKDGNFCLDREHILDLFFVSKRYEGWVNIYRDIVKDSEPYCGKIFASEEEAKNKGVCISATIKIEWEE